MDLYENLLRIFAICHTRILMEDKNVVVLHEDQNSIQKVYYSVHAPTEYVINKYGCVM